jgi:hypothetical protein
MLFASLREVGCRLTLSVNENTGSLGRHARDFVLGRCCAKLFEMCGRGVLPTQAKGLGRLVGLRIPSMKE